MIELLFNKTPLSAITNQQTERLELLNIFKLTESIDNELNNSEIITAGNNAQAEEWEALTADEIIKSIELLKQQIELKKCNCKKCQFKREIEQIRNMKHRPHLSNLFNN